MAGISPISLKGSPRVLGSDTMDPLSPEKEAVANSSWADKVQERKSYLKQEDERREIRPGRWFSDRESEKKRSRSLTTIQYLG